MNEWSSGKLGAALGLRYFTLQSVSHYTMLVFNPLCILQIDLNLNLCILPLYLQLYILRRSKGPCLLPLWLLDHAAWDWSPSSNQ